MKSWRVLICVYVGLLVILAMHPQVVQAGDRSAEAIAQVNTARVVLPIGRPNLAYAVGPAGGSDRTSPRNPDADRDKGVMMLLTFAGLIVGSLLLVHILVQVGTTKRTCPD